MLRAIRSLSAKASMATMNWTVTGSIGAQPECSRPNAFSSLLLPRKSWENRRAMALWILRGCLYGGAGASGQGYDPDREEAQGFHNCCTCTTMGAECLETQHAC